VTNESRTPGKYGRVAPDPEKPVLILERYLSSRGPLKLGGLPDVSLDEDVDRASAVKDWPMYLNDRIGDCTIAGLAHMFGALSQYGKGTEAMFTDDVVQHVYSSISGYDPNAGPPDDNPTDTGCQMSDVLKYAHHNGIPDTSGKVHKVAGYAKLGNPTNPTLVGQVLDVCGTAYTGIVAQSIIQREFSENKPFTWQKNGEVEGGHCIVLQRRHPKSQAKQGIYEYVTWGALARATSGFMAHAVEEAWFVVTEDWLNDKGDSVEGLDLSQLLADMKYV
jgi:hypothetical protein